MNGRGCYAPFTIDTERLKLPLGMCRVYVERASKKYAQALYHFLGQHQALQDSTKLKNFQYAKPVPCSS